MSCRDRRLVAARSRLHEYDLVGRLLLALGSPQAAPDRRWFHCLVCGDSFRLASGEPLEECPQCHPAEAKP